VNPAVLQPAGPAAQAIAEIGWLLIIGAGAIFMAVMSLLGWALRRHAPQLRAAPWIAGAGVAFPIVVLVALFVYALPLSPSWRPVPPAGALVISVEARMWWWEVRYPGDGGASGFVTANEIHIPAGRPVYLALSSADVIHSFWVPALGGKMDMVPGRMQHLLLSADQPGVLRGQCAEYCGEQHARMALHVVAQEPQAFEAWRQAQAQPAITQSAQHARGMQAFLANRCDACHTIRGVTGESRLGPDLTHIGSRLFLGAGTLPNTPSALSHWVAHVQHVKPGARMPSSHQRLDAETLAVLANWLGSLR
jgi:cytochrome c oxidase subunit II